MLILHIQLYNELGEIAEPHINDDDDDDDDNGNDDVEEEDDDNVVDDDQHLHFHMQ